MDLHATLPDFPTAQFAHILPALERAEVTVKELLLYDALEIAKQTQVAVTDIRRLTAHLLDALHQNLRMDSYIHNEDDSELLLQEADETTGATSASAGTLQLYQQCISTLDDVLDSSLAGGIRTGYVTEITGERYG
jgi:DNA repair protein RAD57